MEKPYPSRNGIPLNPHEVGILPHTPDNTSENMTIHHGAWPLSYYEGGSLILSTFRAVETNQHNLWESQHNLGRASLHHLYLPPTPPTIDQAMDFIVEAHETGVPLQYGTNSRRIYKKITTGVLHALTREYNATR